MASLFLAFFLGTVCGFCIAALLWASKRNYYTIEREE